MSAAAPWTAYAGQDEQGPWSKYAGKPEATEQPRTTYHSNPSFAGYAPPNSPARTVAQTPAAKEHQDTVLPYIHNPDAAPNADLFKLGAEAIPLGLGIGGAVEAGGLTGRTLLGVGRGLIGSAAGAYGGQKIGGSLGGMAGETGRKIGEGVGALAGGVVGGGLAAGLEREPASFNQRLAGEPGRIKYLPGRTERFIPDWMVPGPSEDALASEQALAKQEQIGSWMNRGYKSQLGAGGPGVGGRPLLGAGEEGPIVVPEPRAPFEGETPNYMASVPRDELERLAQSAKPGAGKQLQQLGRPIIYRPKGYFGDE